MSKTTQTLTLLFYLILFHIAFAQQLESEIEKSDPLNEFQHVEDPQDKFNFLMNAEKPYSESSGYDWLATINVYLDSARKTKDSSQIKLYQILESKVFADLGDYNKSLTLIKGLYQHRDSLPQEQTEAILNILDANYGGLRMYDRQIEIRKEKRKYGFTEQIQFYDIYAKMGMYRRAMVDYIDDVSNTIKENDYLGKALYYNVIGDFLRMDNSAATALIELNKANSFLQIYMQDESIEKNKADVLESKKLLAIIEGNIGKCLVDTKKNKDAIAHLKSSLNKLKELTPKKNEGDIISNTLYLAEAHLQLNQIGIAKNLLATEFENLDINQTLKRNRLLGNYYTSIADFKSASEYFRKNDRIADSLKRNENFILKQQLNEIVGESDYENRLYRADKQRQENEEMRSLLQESKQQSNLIIVSLVFTLLGFGGLIYAYLRSIKNQRLIEQQKSIIEGQLKEKESLLREIHHRVKNNLQMVSSLLSLQTKNTKSKAAIVALEEGKTRVKAMALIHQKLYQNEDLSYIEMQGYIESLINSVQSVYKKGGHNISITIDAEGTELDIDHAIPFGLVLNELVSNSFKYAFPESDDNGQIYIHLRKNGEQGFFEYTDNGVGLPEEIDGRTHSSMGLRLINRLVNQLQSKLNIDRDVEGVRFWFTFS